MFPENLGSHLSIDETALSKGELYTIVTNKLSKGKKGSLVAIFSGTKVDGIVEKLKTISKKLRYKVKEVTLDMASSMKQIVSQSFPGAVQVTDRFHVQKLAIDALQSLRIDYRWKAIKEENKAVKEARKNKVKHQEEVFENGDTRKELLARSRYILFKAQVNWTQSQQSRGAILFKEYPTLKKGYGLIEKLRNIYNQEITPQVAITKLAHWYKDVEDFKKDNFNTVVNSLQNNYQSIVNYFYNRSTNASAESFNAKIKAFRTQFRGVRDVNFFLYRLTKLFA